MLTGFKELPEVRMSMPLAARAPDPSALAAYWAEYEDLCRQISPGPHIDDDDTHYEVPVLGDKLSLERPL
ncbi:unnamed protein product [Diatraea saccharalis]|uniref:Uncharacterized protein n=1 Tax=Diatraea saccharalis TaxID=40085 RepID=A0A9N9WKI4_9NEOP|nr:unnamed protein product [Diatraea saccharalis]